MVASICSTLKFGFLFFLKFIFNFFAPILSNLNNLNNLNNRLVPKLEKACNGIFVLSTDDTDLTDFHQKRICKIC
jgi:hypothetical protein